MGICRLPTLEMYWSVDYADFGPSIARKVMPRDRFRQLLRCFHVNAIDPIKSQSQSQVSSFQMAEE